TRKFCSDNRSHLSSHPRRTNDDQLIEPIVNKVVPRHSCGTDNKSVRFDPDVVLSQPDHCTCIKALACGEWRVGKINCKPVVLKSKRFPTIVSNCSAGNC